MVMLYNYMFVSVSISVLSTAVGLTNCKERIQRDEKIPHITFVDTLHCMAPITHIEKKKLNYFYLVLHVGSGGCFKHLPDALLALGRAREVGKGVDPLHHCLSLFFLAAPVHASAP